jgi:hypothetical protein
MGANSSQVWRAGSGGAFAVHWANGIIETDPRVTKRVNHELRPAHDIICRTRTLHILMDGLGTDAENYGNFPVGLPLRNEAQAFDFAATEPWPRTRRRGLPKPPGSRQRMRADELCTTQSRHWHVGSGAHCERTGRCRLARYICWHREAAANAEIAAAREDAPLAMIERDQ